MQITGKMAKYAPFTKRELRTLIAEHCASWFLVFSFGLAFAGTIAGFRTHDSDALARYSALAFISFVGAVAFFRIRDESTAGFIKSWWCRNHLRYAVLFSRRPSNPAITVSWPFFISELGSWLENTGYRNEDGVFFLLPLDGSPGASVRGKPWDKIPGWKHDRHIERMEKWRFCAANLHDSPETSAVKVRDPDGGETTMLLSDAMDFVRDAPFGAADIGDGQCTFVGFQRYSIAKISDLAAALKKANGDLDAARRDFDGAVNLSTDTLSRIYASRELATSRELESVRYCLEAGLRRLLPEGDKRIPTPVARKPEPAPRSSGGSRWPWD